MTRARNDQLSVERSTDTPRLVPANDSIHRLLVTWAGARGAPAIVALADQIDRDARPDVGRPRLSHLRSRGREKSGARRCSLLVDLCTLAARYIAGRQLPDGPC